MEQVQKPVNIADEILENEDSCQSLFNFDADDDDVFVGDGGSPEKVTPVATSAPSIAATPTPAAFTPFQQSESASVQQQQQESVDIAAQLRSGAAEVDALMARAAVAASSTGAGASAARRASSKRRCDDDGDDEMVSSSNANALDRPLSAQAPPRKYDDVASRPVVVVKKKNNKGKNNNKGKKKKKTVPKKDDPFVFVPSRVGLTDRQLAAQICRKIYERNRDLIMRIIAAVGADAAVELTNETLAIQEGGGLALGKRMRSTGGILIKKARELMGADVWQTVADGNKQAQKDNPEAFAWKIEEQRRRNRKRHKARNGARDNMQIEEDVDENALFDFSDDGMDVVDDEDDDDLLLPTAEEITG
jgi:hypothetical protein